MKHSKNKNKEIFSEDIQDIIAAPPSWITRWGVTVILVVAIAFVTMSAFIIYPDIIRVPIRISATNTPRPVVSRVPGNINKLLVNDMDKVNEGQPLAWIDAEASHEDMINLLENLEKLQGQVFEGSVTSFSYINHPSNLRLGELKGEYQLLYYLYLRYKKNKLIEHENHMSDETSTFIQALNSLVTKIKNWMDLYVLTAPKKGVVRYAGAIKNQQYVYTGQNIFYIACANTDFFGEIHIPQHRLNKIRTAQKVRIKLDSYPFEEFGTIEGNVQKINDIPLHDSLSFLKVSLNKNSLEKSIELKDGMLGTAEIIAEEVSLLSRFNKNIFNLIK